MIRTYQVEAIVLKRKDIGETDKILTFFTTRFGKISAIAKGIKKIKSKKAPHLEIFTKVRLFLARGKSLDIVTEAQSIHTYPLLRKKINRIAYAYRLIEQVDKLCPHYQPHDDIFQLLNATLLDLEREILDVDKITDKFTLKLLFLLGFIPENYDLKGRDLNSFLEDIIQRSLASNKLLSRVNLNEQLAHEHTARL